MSIPITELTMSGWFRHVGTKLSNEDYEAGIEALHATLTRLHEAEAKLAAVRTLHRPVPVYTNEMGDCEHGDDCEGVEISDGAYCPVHTDGLTCNACAETGEHMDGLPAYPCPTIRALEADAK